MAITQLSSDVKISQAITIAAGATASTPVSSSVINMAGFEGCLFVVQFGPITAGAVTSIKVEQAQVVAMTSAADLLDSSQTVADDADNTVFYIDVVRPREQFLRLVVTRGTQAATVSAMAFQYRSRAKPVTHGAGVSGEAFAYPAEGTA